MEGRAFDASFHSSLISSGKMILKRLIRKKKPQSTEEVSSSKMDSHDRSVSSSKNQATCSNLLELADDLRRNYLRGGPTINQQFLPNNKLEQLVTKESLLSALRETTIEQQYHEDLASWILQNSMRLFLVLDDGVSDRVLPLGFSDDESKYGCSIAMHPTKGTRKFYSFADWEDNDLILFENYQWMFLAPVFGASNKFRLHLNNKQPLPFTELSPKPTKGILGETLSGEIHPAHVDPQCLSALGVVNDPNLDGIPVFIKCIQPSDKLRSFFDINTGEFKATHPIISSRRIHPIAAYQKNGDEFVVFRWVGGDNSSN
ncbi:hypothetical protein F5Y08DRAFT_353752 [Xylaria arbuscula]|nr:hypothetical protein F5Y08DRAFT_353752 [Xylaria arbuscula]